MTWLACATRRDGPPSKHGYPSAQQRTLSQIAGVVGHSMEGSLSAALGELDRLDRRASWTFSNPKAGPLLQHYELEKVTWASGSVEANRLFVAVESEGVAGELLNEHQRKNMAALLTELGALTGLKWERPTTLKEHREMTVYGSAPTACPSNRYPWAQILALMEDDMAVKLRLIRNANGPQVYVAVGGLLVHVPTEEALAANGWTLADVEVLPADDAIWKLPKFGT